MVFPFLFGGSAGISLRWSFHSTISIPNIIPQIQQQILWYSLPNRWGLHGQNTHPGHVHLLNQIDMPKFNSIKLLMMEDNAQLIFRIDDLILFLDDYEVMEALIVWHIH